MDDTIVELKCVKMNPQHSRGATANLIKFAADNKLHIVYVQEPFVYRGRAAGLDCNYKMYTVEKAQI